MVFMRECGGAWRQTAGIASGAADAHLCGIQGYEGVKGPFAPRIAGIEWNMRAGAANFRLSDLRLPHALLHESSTKHRPHLGDVHFRLFGNYFDAQDY